MLHQRTSRDAQTRSVQVRAQWPQNNWRNWQQYL